MPQVSRRHHYIPEFYLKRWASRDGTLVEFSKPYGNTVVPKRVHPKQTGFMDRLYEMRGVRPEQSDLFERKFFAPVDSKAATVLQKIEDEVFDFSKTERSAWANFLMSLVLRHPEGVAVIREYMMANVEQDLANPGHAKWRRGNDDLVSIQESLRQLGTDDGISTVAMNTMTRSISSERIESTLIKTQWGVLQAPPFVPALLTSDRPLIWVNGIANSDFHLLLPVGPKTIFYAVQPGSEMAWRMLFLNVAELTSFMNEHVTRRAVRYVYGRSDWHLKYVQAHMGVNPRPTQTDQVLEHQRMQARARKAPRSTKT